MKLSVKLKIKRFLFPKVTHKYLFRVLSVIVLAFLFFNFICVPSDWNLQPRKVAKNHMYVVGDNRNVPIDIHQFGQTPVNRIIGEPLWKK
jgi:NADH:ubiquinone oxidoreductase subunit H